MMKYSVITTAILTLVIGFIYQPSPAHAANTYMVGVDYHAITSNWEWGSFIYRYNDPQVRATVQSQLAGMAEAGAKIISLRVWVGLPPMFTGGHNATIGLPPTPQELQNIRQFVQDASTVQNPDGKFVKIYLTTMSLRCAHFDAVYPYCYQSRTDFTNAWKTTLSGILNAVGDITRPNGTKAVDTFYMDGEFKAGMNASKDQWFKDLYPYFVSLARSYGITPSVYFQMNNTTMRFLIDGLNFLQSNNMPIPSRIDASYYTNADVVKIKQTMTEIQRRWPGHTIGIAELTYFPDQASRRALGQALVGSYKALGAPSEVVFWTTPYPHDGLPGYAYPFDIKSYYGDIYPFPALPGDLNGDGKVDIYDYNLLVGNFGKTGSNIVGDIDHNNKVDIFDFNILVGNFGK